MLIRRIAIVLLLTLQLVVATAQTSSYADSLELTLKRYHSVYDTNYLNTLLNISWVRQSTNIQNADSLARLAYNLCTKANYQVGIARSLNTLGSISRAHNDLDSARKYFKMAYQVNVKIGNKKRAAENLGNLGIIFSKENRVDSALNYFDQCLNVFESIKDTGGILASYSSIAELLIRTNDNIDGEKYSRRQMAIAETIKDTAHYAIGLDNLATIAWRNHDYKAASDYYLEAAGFKEKIDNQYGLMYTYGNIGMTYNDLGRYYDAIRYIRKSLALCSEFQDSIQLAAGYINLGVSYMRLFESSKNKSTSDSAQRYLITSIDILSRQNDMEQLSQAYFTLQELYSKKNMFHEAHNYLLKYTMLRDSFLTNEYNSKVEKEYLTKFETEKIKNEKDKAENENELKDAQIFQQQTQIFAIAIFFILLCLIAIFIFYKREKNRKISELNKEKNRKINELNRERELILQTKISEQEKISNEIHNEVSNTLFTAREQVVIALQTTNEVNRKNILDAVVDQIESIRKKTRAIAYNIMPASFWTKGLSSGLSEYFNQLNTLIKIKALFRWYCGDISFDQRAERDIFNIIKELITNSLKHGMGLEEIALMVKVEENCLIIILEDDGFGFNSEKLISSKTIGWGFVLSTIQESYKGEIIVASEVGKKGNFFKITLPVSHLQNNIPSYENSYESIYSR
ncbi:tetratricopeptide repeat protein [Panacibacter ginsenosidivorans]|uniref:Tetratricopeptide repeat protein n=1 Tax=Panacibacter ginsenosidivorans TaxID=1813871 RepID=A0A5B8VFF5_9BACT|nr:tetratricopeptide repeat-containing sensor histidine kinase [Panacibacter ginsenosidivorans]QEC69266.1 tetratricopeptide repeat protein [Panacibacter ginsenosidivorans]